MAGLRSRYACRHSGILAAEDRQGGSARLVLLLAGFKPALWPLVLPRLERHLPPETDLCILTPGREIPELRRRCAEKGWSYLATRANQLALALNLAIERHPRAMRVHKLDEDILIARGYFQGLEETLELAGRAGVYEPGFIAPTLNVNGFSYRSFLAFAAPEALEEFRERFGSWRSACMATPAWSDPRAAQFLWEKSLPFDATAARFAARPPGYDVCPHRFSIGAILFERRLWERMGGFTRAREGELGREEVDLCAFCCAESLAMLCAHRVFAGHVGFMPQAPHMLEWIRGQAETLDSGPRTP